MLTMMRACKMQKNLIVTKKDFTLHIRHLYLQKTKSPLKKNDCNSLTTTLGNMNCTTVLLNNLLSISIKKGAVARIVICSPYERQ